MKFIFSLGIMFAAQNLTITISEDRINRIIDAYKNNASVMNNEYDAYGTRYLPLRFYNQVPEIRLHMPYEKFKAIIMKNPITVSLDGKEEFTANFHIKYTVFSHSDKPPVDFYMIITWPHDEHYQFSLLRIYEDERENRQIFLPRSAIDAELLKMTYLTEKKQKAMHKILKDILKKDEAPKEECQKAVKTTGIYQLKNYYISDAFIAVYPTIQLSSLILNEEEVYVIPGKLMCDLVLIDNYGSDLYLTYVLADAVRGWVLVNEKKKFREIIFQGEENTAIDIIVDDKDENI